MPENTVFDLSQIYYDDPVLSRLSDLLDSLLMPSDFTDYLPFYNLAPCMEWAVSE